MSPLLQKGSLPHLLTSPFGGTPLPPPLGRRLLWMVPNIKKFSVICLKKDFLKNFMVIETFLRIIFKPRTAPGLLKSKCIWHSYNSTLIKWKRHDSKLDNPMITKFWGNIYLIISKKLPIFERCGLIKFMKRFAYRSCTLLRQFQIDF